MTMTEPTTPLAPLSRIPDGIHYARDYEFLARRFIAGPSYDYIAGGSGEDVTAVANLAAFSERTITPRLLRDVTAGHTHIHLLGRAWPHPILLAPVAFQKLVHPNAELDTARAAAAMDACMVVSTLSSVGLEDIAAATDREKWFQLYFQARRSDTLDLLLRAEAAGYRAIVITLDASIQAPSLRARRSGFRMPPDCVAVNVLAYAPAAPAEPATGRSPIFQGWMAGAPTWDDLAWLLKETTLPVIVKGVLHPDDACRLRDLGVAGLVVSNHGGRSLDHAPASLRALPSIRAAVGAACPLLFDGGIRSGTDVFKALALGADAVMIGRLQVFALSVAGALGVGHMLKLLREELEICMAQSGCATPADIREADIGLARSQFTEER